MKITVLTLALFLASAMPIQSEQASRIDWTTFEAQVDSILDRAAARTDSVLGVGRYKVNMKKARIRAASAASRARTDSIFGIKPRKEQ